MVILEPRIVAVCRLNLCFVRRAHFGFLFKFPVAIRIASHHAQIELSFLHHVTGRKPSRVPLAAIVILGVPRGAIARAIGHAVPFATRADGF